MILSVGSEPAANHDPAQLPAGQTAAVQVHPYCTQGPSVCERSTALLLLSASAALRAGVLEMSTFSKYRVGGPAAREYLDALLACKLPPPGRMCLAPMLGRDGKL